MKNKNIKVRFAPSPTGALHIGGVRTAIYNWLFARNCSGEFVLRIEDTDRTRSTEDATESIIEGLKWLGLDWDEGPIHQADRLDIYRKYAEGLLEKGAAYRSEEGNAIIYRIPSGEKVVFDDIVYSTIEFSTDDLKDIVLIKSDGFPTYNFACVVDDAEMGITHVIRGDDHISNTPKQILLYRVLGFNVPKFAHLPMILGPDKKRLSKRHGARSVVEYREDGFLPEALINFLSLLGWNPGTDKEIYSIKELIELFSLERVSRKGSVFDEEKLLWMNGQYIKSLDVKKLVELAKNAFLGAAYFKKLEDIDEKWIEYLVETFRDRSKTISELVENTRFLFVPEISYDNRTLEKLFSKRDGIKEALKIFVDELRVLGDFKAKDIEDKCRDIADKAGLKAADLIHPTRFALTGKTVSPPLFDIMELFGRQSCLNRMEEVLKKVS